MNAGQRDEWSIQEVARIAGTTSRTLRHYQAEGLLDPSRIGSNGYRFYDDRALLRLQRILLLRELGLGVEVIRLVLRESPAVLPALTTHLEILRREQQRLARQIASVEHTIETERGGGRIMAEEVFDGFDHTQFKDEVEERWGRASYAAGDSWWTAMSAEERSSWQDAGTSLAAAWREAAGTGATPEGDEARSLARRHVEWLSGIPGTPQRDGQPTRDYVLGLGELYVADPRFAQNYGGAEGAEFVRDALRVYAERNL